MRNLKRLQLEIRILEKVFGSGNISYPSDGSWIKISNYKLPQSECRYNLDFITIQIAIPNEYDNVGVTEIYVDRDLKVKKKVLFVRPPHLQDQNNAEGEGYLWLCFHPADEFIGLLDFINTLKAYFTNPFNYQKL